MDKKKANLKDMTCFNAHAQKNKPCINKKCRYWHDLKDLNQSNCILNVIDKKDSYTLQEVGELFNITRMRVCQIEKSVLEKLRKNLSSTI